jgi:predicted RNase H-like HicB family nuclease
MTNMTMLYWKEGDFWVGKLKDHPEIMTQGESLEELEDNIKDAYLCMVMEDVPDNYGVKEIAVCLAQTWWKARHLL